MSASHSTRFQKGKSGNPNGRPRKKPPVTSAFDIILERTFSVTRDGKERELTVDELLQQKTYEAALKGHKPSRTQIIKMILKREKIRAAARRPVTGTTRIEPEDPDNINDALLLLGIASIRDGWSQRRHLYLEPWAVRAALSRRSITHLSQSQVEDIKFHTRDAGSIHWPNFTTPNEWTE
jgi:hypothetical protein